MRIRNQSFENERVELDGNAFESCTFTNTHLVFQGTGPVSLVDCAFADNIQWEFTGPAANTMQFLKLLVESSGDYGKALILQTFPPLKDMVKPEFLAKFSARKVPQNV
jgi:hypothetical protein